jgi:hypothetical protein
MTAPAPLAFHQLDQDLIVWGVAVLFDLGVYAVTAYPSAQDAQIAAGATNAYAELDSDVAHLVYHHPDRGWVFAATDTDCRVL